MKRFCVVLLLFALPALAAARDIEVRLLSGRGLLHLPASVKAPAPLVVLLHGSSQTPEKLREITAGQWETLAERHGFALLYGEGLKGVWNINTGPAPARMMRRRDDFAFLQALIGKSATHTPIDAKQIYAVGFSMGGQMVIALACAKPHLFRGIASVAHPLPLALKSTCARGPPLPVVFVHGENDPLVPMEGGTLPSGIDAGLEVMSLEASRAVFAARNGADAPARALPLAKHGHSWPGGIRDFPALYLGPLRKDVNGAALIWAEFASHMKKGPPKRAALQD
ncbi:MAG: alpha/beta hydrolase family esterase [Maritimibacter sp.]